MFTSPGYKPDDHDDRWQALALVLEEQQLGRGEGQLERVQHRRVLQQQHPHARADPAGRAPSQHFGAMRAQAERSSDPTAAAERHEHAQDALQLLGAGDTVVRQDSQQGKRGGSL